MAFACKRVVAIQRIVTELASTAAGSSSGGGHAAGASGAGSCLSGWKNSTCDKCATLGRDLFIELGAAAQNVEWAGALGAHVLPEEVDGYSAAAASGFLVALSSGGARRPILTRRPNELTLAKDLLAFDNDTSVIDFLSNLGKGDLARIGPLIAGLANGTAEESKEKLRLWNAEVRRYERRPDRLRTFGVSGIVLAAASQLSSDGNIRSIVPLMAPFMPFLLTQLNEELVRDSAVVGALQDWANGALAGAAPGAVLVSRLRKRIGGMKERK